MTTWLEIVMPMRNPAAPLMESVSSLLTQTAGGFSVLLSDNHSTRGLEQLDAAQKTLEQRGVSVRRVCPPIELGRVQHWNWAHAHARTEWIKPLFVGDLLLPKYVERLGERVRRQPGAGFVRCEFEIRVPGRPALVTSVPFKAESLTPAGFLQWFPSHGNWIGAPINAAFRREAWQAAGGYPVHLPACADLSLAVTTALHHGLETIPESLAVFQLHEQRFPHGISKRRVLGCFELWLILRAARNYCQNTKLPWPAWGVTRGVARQGKVDYWQPFKMRVKQGWRPTTRSP